MIGKSLSHYRIIARLGEGGMGVVYRAEDPRLGREVAIKVLPGHLSQDPALRQRLEREARAISSLNHPHICTLYDIGHQDGVDFLVMELLEGETLAEQLERGAMSLEEVLKTGMQVAEGLAAAHRQGLVHRDLKPGNIMMTPAGAKLLDFGLAKATAPGERATSLTATPTLTSPLTAAGTLVGTFQYMAPEQLEGSDAGAPSDVFAFGALLYEMVTGRRAFDGKTQASVIARILESEPARVSALQPMTPPALERLIDTCLAKDPEQRRQSMHDVLLDLQWIAEQGPGSETPASPGPGRRGRQRLAWGLVAALAVAGGALGFLLWRALSPQPPVVRALVPAPEGVEFHSMGRGPGGAGPVAISPDGRRLAFVARDSPGSGLLYVRPLDSLTARPLPGTEGARYPFWSPDSRSIGFFSGGKLRRIDAAGGPPLALCDAPNGRSGTWSREGVIVFAPDSRGPLHRVPSAGGSSTPVTDTGGGRDDETHRWPWFLPDGRRFLYYARAAGGASAGDAVLVGSIDGSEDVLLFDGSTDAAYASGHLLFVRDGTLMAWPFDASALEFTGDPFPLAEQIRFDGSYDRGVFSASENGVLVYQSGGAAGQASLEWFDREGRPLGRLGVPGDYVAPRFSPDRKSVAVQIGSPSDIWIYDVDRGIRTRFTFSPSSDVGAVWSPDGERIVFSSDRNGAMNLFVKSLGAPQEPRQLLETEQRQFATSWSADGRWIAYFMVDPDTGSDIWALPIAEGGEPLPVVRTPFNERRPRFSPDGRWLAYHSDESGKFEVYVTPFPGPGRKHQVSVDGGRYPVWRDDSTEIFYLAAEFNLMAAEIEATDSTFRVGSVAALFGILPGGPFEKYDVTADGQRFLVNSAQERATSVPLTVVINWTAELPK